MEGRKNYFKPTNFIEPKTRCEEISQKLRKNQRHINFSLKRMKIMETIEFQTEVLQKINPKFSDILLPIENQIILLKDYLRNIDNLQKIDENLLYAVILKLRIFISCPHQNFSAEIVDIEFIKKLLEIIPKIINYKILYEIIWILLNISALNNEKYTKILLSKDFLQILINYCEIKYEELCEISLWCLGNLLDKNNAEFFAEFPISDMIFMILKIGNKIKISLLKTAVWVLSRIIECGIKISEENIKEFCKNYGIYLEFKDSEIDNEILKILAIWTEKSPHFLIKVFDLLPIGKICSLITENLYALLIIGNLCNGAECFIKPILRAGLLQNLKIITSSYNQKDKINIKSENMLKEAIWIILNISASSEENIDFLIAEGILSEIHKLIFFADLETKKDAICIILNICKNGSIEQREFIGQNFAFECLLGMINENIDSDLLLEILEGISELLETGENLYENKLFTKFDEIGGVEKLDSLLYHKNIDIFNKAQYLLDTYCYGDHTELEFAMKMS